jgi:hypothetical protein
LQLVQIESVVLIAVHAASTVDLQGYDVLLQGDWGGFRLLGGVVEEVRVRGRLILYVD